MSTRFGDTRKVLGDEVARLYRRILELEDESWRRAGTIRTLLQENEVLRDALGRAVVAGFEERGIIVARPPMDKEAQGAPVVPVEGSSDSDMASDKHH